MKPKTYKNAELLTAARIVAQKENVSMEFVLATQTPSQIFGWCKAYNDQHLENMDTIRQWW